MLGKPFRSPLLKQPLIVKDEARSIANNGNEYPAKKRKIIDGHDIEPKRDTSGPRLIFKAPGVSALPRKPLLTVQNPAVAVATEQTSNGAADGYYNVLWRRYTTKKHKTWDGDGILHVTNGYAILQDISGKDMGRTICDSPLLSGSVLSLGGKEVEVDSILPKAGFLAGRSLEHGSTPKPIEQDEPAFVPFARPISKAKTQTKTAIDLTKQPAKKPHNVASPRNLGTQAPWKNPTLASTIMSIKDAKTVTPRHNPCAARALVMKRPQTIPKGRQLVDVVVDPLLSEHLREHQREGVEFMYECVMGMRAFDGQGAILADEMGLGKTLQTIAVLWTLLKQNPIYDDPPVVKKALIVCPVTLINNWRKEFRKWLGTERIGVFVADEKKKRLTDFTLGRSYSIMIIGYEKLRTVQEELKKGPGIDIVIADEGHRLKTAKNKSAQAIKALNTPRRIILSGTPIQNDLSEFYMMVDFVNPDLLNDVKTFTKQFETPIVKSRQPGAKQEDLELGEARSEELASLTGMFILRRTAEVLSKFLPPKTEYVLFCRPTANQALAYQHVLACPAFQAAMGNTEASLQLITVLKKVCNSPALLSPKDPAAPLSPMMAAVLSSIPPNLLRSNAGSTKLRALDQLLHTFRTTTSEKVVIVSNYTSTLDLLSILLTSLGHPFLRLDGTTPSSKRQDLVDTFNRTSASACFAFLLSAKAGGMGINLIGASRLVLFDVDWNPATDMQVMARIHRDGQKKPCFIYRLVMAGGLDEKIWQRQITKIGLASNIIDQKGGGNNFTRDELRDLFRLDEGLNCQTHDLLGCECGGRGMPAAAVAEETPWTVLDSESDDDNDEDLPLISVGRLTKANELDVAAQEQKIKEDARKARRKGEGDKMKNLMAYSHIDTSAFKNGVDENMEALIRDEVLLRVIKDEDNRISFAFAKTSG
ncbi:MAG: hypothetical protein Q9195_004249 [Heterodermia aff. obscurata]